MSLYHKIIPYVIMGSASFMTNHNAHAQDASLFPFAPQTRIELPRNLVEQLSNNLATPNRLIIPVRLARRATETRRQFVENLLAAQKRLKSNVGRVGYAAAVRRELPNAPVGAHCMYGQYTQLMRALEQNGDTLTVIPNGGERECTHFKKKMCEKYGTPEYAGALHEGCVFESDSAYNAALEKYLAKRGMASDSINSPRRKKATAEFAARNFSVNEINPGSIWIVPRYHGSRTCFHAIMFLGAGRIENGEFVPDENGVMMYAAHNRERIGDLFKTWDTSNVFCADIEKILAVEYTKELQKLESMSVDEMAEYLADGSNVNPIILRNMPRNVLMQMVRDKYFSRENTIKNTNVINMPGLIAYKSKEVTR